MMPDSSDALERLLGGVGAATFLTDHWEQRHLLVREADPRGFADLFSLARMDQSLASGPLSHDRLSVVRNGADLFPRQGGGTGEPSLEEVYAEFRRGASLVTLGLEDRWEPVQRLGRSLGAALSVRVQVNAYLTPASAQALKAHYDTHDVFVLQTHGTKTWWIGPRVVAAPLPEAPWRPRSPSDDETAEGSEIDLHPGDVLYLPRGTLHRAVARDATSLHLTVGIHPMTWAGVLRAALDDLIEHDDRYRRALPVGFARDPAIQERAVGELGEKLRGLVGDVDAEGIVKGVVESARALCSPDLAGHLLDLEDVPHVDRDTVVRRRPDSGWRLVEHAEEVALHFHGKKVTVPARVRESLTFVTEVEGDFSPVDLVGLLDPDSAVRLTRRLLAEGFLTRPRRHHEGDPAECCDTHRAGDEA